MIMKKRLAKHSLTTFFCVLFFLINGCTAVIVKPILQPINLSIQQQDDIALLKDGAPSLLLMIDGFIAENPENTDLLLDGTRAYVAYASALAELGEMDRAVTVSRKAKKYGIRLLQNFDELDASLTKPLTEFNTALGTISRRDIDKLFWGGFGWATWISLQGGAPAAMIDLPRVEKIMLRVLELNDAYYYGTPHVFLGYYYGSIPPMYGGKPEESRYHFEAALKVADRRFLTAQVAYAESYAKMQFNRDLYESLLKEVLERPVDAVPELTSSNQLSKIKAKRLLDAVDEYF